jgi:hypothetical protein
MTDSIASSQLGMSGSVHPGFTKPPKQVEVSLQLTGEFEDGETEQTDNEREFLGSARSADRRAGVRTGGLARGPSLRSGDR